jgi:hypothetical protein
MFQQEEKPQPYMVLAVQSMRLFAAAFGRAAPPAVLAAVLLAGLCWILAFYLQTDEDAENNKSGIFWIATIVLTCFPAFASGVLYRVQAVAEGRDVRLTETLQRSAACLLPGIAAGLLYMLAVSLGTVLLVLPGIFLSISLCFWWPGMVIDRKGMFDALWSSVRLAHGHWWRTALSIAAVYAILSGITGIGNRLFDMIPEAYSDGWLMIGMVVLAAMANFVIIMVLFSAIVVVHYNDLKLRLAEKAHA